MILKAGQIYIAENGLISVITAVGFNEFFFITPDGSANRIPVKHLPIFEEKAKLVAEYPTWQQAVASEEFNGIPIKKLN